MQNLSLETCPRQGEEGGGDEYTTWLLYLKENPWGSCGQRRVTKGQGLKLIVTFNQNAVDCIQVLCNKDHFRLFTTTRKNKQRISVMEHV